MSQQLMSYAERARIWVSSGDATVELVSDAIERVVFQLKQPTTPKEKINDIDESLSILREWLFENVEPETLDRLSPFSEDICVGSYAMVADPFLESNLRYDEPEIKAPLHGQARIEVLNNILSQNSLLARGAIGLKKRCSGEINV